MIIENKNEYIDLDFYGYATQPRFLSDNLSDKYNLVEIAFAFNIADVGCGITADGYFTTQDIAAVADGLSRVRSGEAQEFTLSGRYPYVNAGEKPFFTVDVRREGELIRFSFTIFDGMCDDITLTEMMSPSRFEEIAEEFKETTRLYPVREKRKMDRTEFDRRLPLCTSPRDLSVLADEILEELIDGADAAEVQRQMEILLDAGLDPSVPPRGEAPLFLENLAYAECDASLDIAGMIFDRCGVPEDFFDFVQFRVDYHCYNDPCAVKLYLLAASYLWEREETYITMSENLYEEMFDPLHVYTSFEEDYRKCSLTPAIFRDIGKYDFMVEMLPQKAHRCNLVIRIFDRESRIEVAQYRGCGKADSHCSEGT